MIAVEKNTQPCIKCGTYFSFFMNNIAVQNGKWYGMVLKFVSFMGIKVISCNLAISFHCPFSYIDPHHFFRHAFSITVTG